MTTPERLIALFHHRWSVPALAELHHSHGAKLITLARRTGASPSSMRQTIDHLVDLGWVRRNPGYGHPLRPEYLLTKRGERVGPVCGQLLAAIESALDMNIALKKWTLPALHAIGRGPARFGEIASRLTGITDRALALSLRDLQHESLVLRDVHDGRPPFAAYNPSPNARRLSPILNRLRAA